MSVFQAILCGLIYYAGNGNILGGYGYYTAYRPLVAGFLTGCILGDPVTGTIIGGTINLMYIGAISAGGALASDMCLAGIVGTAVGITSGLAPEAAMAVAVPIGLLGTLLWFGRLTVDTIFVRGAEKMVAKGQTDKIWIMDFLLPQQLLLVVTVVPCALACYFGAQYIEGFLNMLGSTVLSALITIGGMMPALGVAITLKFIFKGDAKVFFLLGFLMTAYLSLGMTAVGFFSICIVLIYMQVTKNKEAGVNG